MSLDSLPVPPTAAYVSLYIQVVGVECHRDPGFGLC